jgi:hypothetical protein
MDDLLKNKEDVPQETTDAIALAPLSHPSAFVFPLGLWASVGFPADGHIFLIALNPPSPCPDGTPRTLYDYISYLIAADLNQTISGINSKLYGITVSYILSKNTIQVVASKSS